MSEIAACAEACGRMLAGPLSGATQPSSCEWLNAYSCPSCVIRDYAVEPPGRVGSGPSSELYRATRTASEDGWWLPGHPCDHGASLRVPSRWTTTVQARAR